MKHINMDTRDFDESDISSYDLRLTNRANPPEEDEYSSFEQAYDWELDEDWDADDMDYDEYDDEDDYLDTNDDDLEY